MFKIKLTKLSLVMQSFDHEEGSKPNNRYVFDLSAFNCRHHR